MKYLNTKNCQQNFQNILRTDCDNNNFNRQQEYKLAGFGNRPTGLKIWKKNHSNLLNTELPNEKKHIPVRRGSIVFDDNKKPV